MHFATAVKFVLGMRVVVATSGAIVAANIGTIATVAGVNIAYSLGFILGSLVSSIGLPVLLLVLGLLIGAALDSECEQYCNELNNPDPATCTTYTYIQDIFGPCPNIRVYNHCATQEEYYLAYTQWGYSPGDRDNTNCISARFWSAGKWKFSILLRATTREIVIIDSVEDPLYESTFLFEYPHGGECVVSSEEITITECPTPHEPDNGCDCNNQKKVWLQVIYGSLDDSKLNNNFTSAKGCWIVGYQYDADNNLSIAYNPGLNEEWLKFKALKPNEVDSKLASNIEVKNDIETAKGWDRAYWNAIKLDTECRQWQPGDLIPTK
ncbi:MAG: hypothetical protein WAN66_14100 [Limnoraphis robusta]|uniref:Uncharacterized protein n=1 Tax=Limnoraphis robusta CS-951 TaxID=1637645 RepID=A0A0F5YKS4_9CYAN|nr:hypothetical protein [Limnoraphis robusta]KKD38775.2 hypothetical protein WN50_06940 [Limnoraphis robusta CS-951]